MGCHFAGQRARVGYRKRTAKSMRIKMKENGRADECRNKSGQNLDDYDKGYL